MSSIISNPNSSSRMYVDQLDLNTFTISTITKDGKVPGETILANTISGLTNNTEISKTMMSSLSTFMAEDAWFRFSNGRRYCRCCCQVRHPNKMFKEMLVMLGWPQLSLFSQWDSDIIYAVESRAPILDLHQICMCDFLAHCAKKWKANIQMFAQILLALSANGT